MNTPPSPVPDETRSTVESLTEQRILLQQWLARLDEVRSDVPDRVAERVRADYEGRLRAVTGELSTHREAIRGDLEARTAELERAEARRAETVDLLEELRLRHRIGEVPDDEWTARRPELEEAVSSAEGEVARVRGEVERLTSLLSEMDGEAPGEAPTATPAEEAPFTPSEDDTVPEYAVPYAEVSTRAEEVVELEVGEVGDVDLSWLEEIQAGAAAAAEPEPGSAAVDDLAFLEELDRAIAASAEPEPQPPSPPAGREDPDRTLDADRAGMLLCKECGAINDPQAWYCEVCGSEL